MGNHIEFFFDHPELDDKIHVRVIKHLSYWRVTFISSLKFEIPNETSLLNSIKEYFKEDYPNLAFKEELEKSIFEKKKNKLESAFTFLQEMFETIEKKAEEENVGVIFYQKNPVASVVLNQLGCAPWKQEQALESILSFRNGGYSHFKSLRAEGLVEPVRFIRSLKDSFHHLETKYPVINYRFKEYSKVEFYYAGKDRNLIAMNYDKDGFYLQYEEEKFYIERPEDMMDTLEKILKKIYNSTRLTHLYKPDLHYLKLYTGWDGSILDQLYEGLSKFLTYDEMEEKSAIAFKCEERMERNDYQDYQIYTILGYYALFWRNKLMEVADSLDDLKKVILEHQKKQFELIQTELESQFNDILKKQCH